MSSDRDAIKGAKVAWRSATIAGYSGGGNGCGRHEWLHASDRGIRLATLKSQIAAQESERSVRVKSCCRRSEIVNENASAAAVPTTTCRASQRDKWKFLLSCSLQMEIQSRAADRRRSQRRERRIQVKSTRSSKTLSYSWSVVAAQEGQRQMNCLCPQNKPMTMH